MKALLEAREAGVSEVISIGIDAETSLLAAGFSESFDGVYAAVGLHPHNAEQFDEEFVREIERLVELPSVVAIGECGLDFYREIAPREAQHRAFSGQIALARRFNLPLVVHVRDAGSEAMAQLAEEADGLTVVMHCYSLPQYVDECNERGYYASFAGNVTFNNAGDLREAAARVREDRLLVETDAPYLAPVPRRGKSNVPGWVAHTAAAVAEVRGWSLSDLAEITTANAHRAFGLEGGGRP